MYQNTFTFLCFSYLRREKVLRSALLVFLSFILYYIFFSDWALSFDTFLVRAFYFLTFYAVFPQGVYKALLIPAYLYCRSRVPRWISRSRLANTPRSLSRL